MAIATALAAPLVLMLTLHIFGRTRPPQGVDVRRVEIPVTGHRNSEGYLLHARHGTWTHGVRQHLPGGQAAGDSGDPGGTGKSNL